MEMKRHHLIEQHDKILETIQDLKEKLGISVDGRWKPGSSEWVAVGEKVRLCRYQQALDALEGLVVSRIFELSKMNMPQTGESLLFTLPVIITNYYGMFQVTSYENTSPRHSKGTPGPSRRHWIITMPLLLH
jgi:hypothetical protein